jgi:hypothetical protein
VRHIALKHPIAAALKSAKAASYLALGSTACAFLLPAVAPAEVAMGRSTSFSVCDPLGTPSLLTNSVAATGVVAGRGGSVREPDLGQAHDDLPASAKGQADPGLSTTSRCTSTWSATGASERLPTAKSARS